MKSVTWFLDRKAEHYKEICFTKMNLQSENFSLKCVEMVLKLLLNKKNYEKIEEKFKSRIITIQDNFHQILKCNEFLFQDLAEQSIK